MSVPLVDKLGSVDNLLLLDRNGSVVQNNTLHNVGGRRGKSLFKTYITVPSKVVWFQSSFNTEPDDYIAI